MCENIDFIEIKKKKVFVLISEYKYKSRNNLKNSLHINMSRNIYFMEITKKIDIFVLIYE
jgi:hypothetical protein